MTTMEQTAPLAPPKHRALTISWQVIFAGLLAGVATASGIALTTTSGWLIVRASERPQIMLLLTTIVAVRTFGIARPVFRYWERLRSHDVSLADLATRRAEVYSRLVPLTPARLGRRGRADLLTGVVDDLTDVVEASVRVTVPVIGALFAGVLAAALTAMVDPAAGLVLAAMLAAAALTVWVCWRIESRSQDELLAARAEVTRVSQLTADHASELAAIGGTKAALGWVDRAHVALRGAISRQSRGRALVAGMVLAITGAATVANAWIATTSDHRIPVMALLVLAPVATGEAIGVLTDATRALARAQGSARRLDVLLGQTPAVSSPTRGGATEEVAHLPSTTTAKGAAPRIVLDGVTATWTGERSHTGPHDLTIEPGEHVAVTGANGSGKSTLLAVLARHLDPSSGRYLVDGVDVTTAPLDEVRSLIALVDDEPHVFASTLRENLRLAIEPDRAAEVSDEELIGGLRAAGLGNWYDALDAGLDTRLGADGMGISGGERARLAIARALLSGRPIIVLDEPVAHLDHPTAEAVLQDLLTTARDRTLVMVTHHGIGVEHFDRTITL